MRIHRWMTALLVVASIAGCLTAEQQQKKKASESGPTTTPKEKPLVFTEAIPLDDAKGRFDHFAMGGGKLFVAALGSNAVEVINVGGRTLDHTITGIPNPQGVAFSPETNKLFVASGKGKVYVYRSEEHTSELQSH